MATKTALTATEHATTKRIELPTVTPQKLAKVFGNPTYVATDIPYRSQAEVDEAAKALADELASSFAEFEGIARGNPKLRAGASVSIDGLGEPFDGKYTITTSRHRFDPITGYSTSFSVTGRRNRTLLGLASGGGRGEGAGRHRDRPGQRRGRSREGGPGQADVPVAVGRLRQRLGADGAAGSGQGPRLAGVARGRRRGAGGVRAGDFGRPTVVGGLFNGVDTMPRARWIWSTAAPARINRRSMVSRLGHRIDLVDASGKEAVRVATTGEKLKLIMDHTGTTITLHADGKVSIEGTQGITIDSASANIDLKGNQISLKATSGVTVDGGSGAVDVKSGSQLSLTGVSAKLEGSGTTEVKGGAMCSIQAAMVKIN